MIKKILNLVMCLGLLLQNFGVVVPVMAVEKEQESLEIVSVKQGNAELILKDGKYQVNGVDEINVDFLVKNKDNKTKYIYYTESSTMGTSWGEVSNEHMYSNVYFNTNNKEAIYTYRLCESNKNYECVKVLDEKTLNFELTIYDEIVNPQFYITKIEQGGQVIEPFDLEYNSHVQFNLNKTQDVKMLMTGNNLKDNIKYQLKYDSFIYEFTGEKIKKGIELSIPMNVVSNSELNITPGLEIFNSSLPILYKSSNGLIYSFDFLVNESDLFESSVVKIKYKDKEVRIDKNAPIYFEGDVYIITPSEYDKTKNISLNIESKDLEDKEYKTRVKVTKNYDTLYDNEISINGLLLNEGYNVELNNLELKLPQEISYDEEIYKIYVSVNDITTRVYLSYKESGVLKTSLFYGTGEKTIIMQGGLETIYGGGYAYEVNSSVFEKYNSMYFHYIGKDFESDINYNYEFYYGKSIDDMELVSSGKIAGKRLNESGFMQEINNNKGYNMPDYLFVVKKEDNLVYYGRNTLINKDEPSLTTVRLKSNNKNVYMQMTDYKYLATKNGPLSIVIDGIGFEDNKEYSFVIDDSYTYGETEGPNTIYKVKGKDLNDGTVSIKISKWQENKPNRSIYIDLFDDDGNFYSYGGFEIKYVDSKKYFPTDIPYVIDNAKDLIKSIKKETKVNDFTASINIIDDGNIKVYDSMGETEITGNVGTGMIARITDEYDNNIMDLEVVVKGDVSGDGNISITDLVKVKRHLSKTEELTGVYEVAGNVSDTEEISITDLVKISRDVAKIQEVQ